MQVFAFGGMHYIVNLLHTNDIQLTNTVSHFVNPLHQQHESGSKVSFAPSKAAYTALLHLENNAWGSFWAVNMSHSML